MAPLRPRTHLDTHEVTNQPPPFEDVNLYELDRPLREAVAREGGKPHESLIRMLGARCGSAEVMAWAEAAHRYPPELKAFDRFGQRIDEVNFHPAYHHLMDLGLGHQTAAIAWTAKTGGHVAHTALEYLMAQAEPGVCCPITMTYAAVAALRHQPEVAEEWAPRLTAGRYDPASRPANEKTGATVGMAMTEKQGGSDVRANTTSARPLGKGGPGAEYELTGHKWFCSAPMCDAFLTLAYTDKGLSCFLVPRWRPDGTRNQMLIMRLKEKLGDRSNASSEIEYHGAYARMVGEEGRGVRTILEMVHHTRLDCTLAPAAYIRQALNLAHWHAMHRTAFQKKLIDQPLMRRVLADLALESEAATALTFRVARSFDEAGTDEAAALFSRLATPVAKYWLNKRVVNAVFEAMECLGGAGYVEENRMPRLYRQAPLNGIWEGSGNVICLDVLRAMGREPRTVEAVLMELEAARGGNAHLDRFISTLTADLARQAPEEGSARLLTERMALALQGALLARHAPAAVADAFCAARLGGEAGHVYGTLPGSADLDAILERAAPG